MRKRLLTKLSLLTALFFTCFSAFADDDVTSTYLTNAGFDNSCYYTVDSTSSSNLGTSSGGTSRDVTGWTTVTGAWSASGAFEYGTGATLNAYEAAPISSTGLTGAGNGAVGFASGWGNSIYYYQTVTLPAGTYKLVTEVYNSFTATSGTSLLGFVTESGTTYTSSMASFPLATWTKDSVTFSLATATTGNIRIGMTSANSSSSANAHPFFDYIQLIKLSAPTVIVDQTDLYFDKFNPVKTFTVTGTNLTNDVTLTAPSGITLSATSLTASEAAAGVAITATYDNATAITLDSISIVSTGTTSKYITLEADNTNETNATTAITNPSFETGDMTGWTNDSGFWTQSNKSMTGVSGSYYAEKWQSSGNFTGLVLSQTLENLPAGYYKLTVAAQNSPNTTGGAFIYAGGTASDEVFTAKDYTAIYCLPEGDPMEIGYEVDNGGNWVAVDNFRLQYLGASAYFDVNTDSLSLDGYTTDTTFTISGVGLSGNLTLTAPTGITLDKTTITPDEVGVGAVVTVTYDKSVDITDGVIAITDGTTTRNMIINAISSDYTTAIVNPSFENDLTGWTNNGMASQTNSSFSKKSGATYTEKWTSSGSSLDNCGIVQTITGLPNGVYTLTASAQAMQQYDSSYPGAAYIVANDDSTEVTSPDDYSVNVTVTDGTLLVGFRSYTTGNWVCLDNFRLTYLGSATILSTTTTYLSMDDISQTGTFTLAAGNLTSDATITASSGFTVSPTTISASAVNGSTITVIFDGTAEAKGYVTVTSGDKTLNVRVLGFLNSTKYTPLYSTANLISNPYFTTYDGYETAWGTKSLTTDTTVVYNGKSSALLSGNCAGTINYDITGVEPYTYYRVQFAYRTLDGTLQYTVDECGIEGSTSDGGEKVYILPNTNDEWAIYDNVFLTQELTGSTPYTYINSCGDATSTKSYIDDYQLFKMPMYIAKDTIAFSEASDSTFNIVSQVLTGDLTITAPSGFSVSPSTIEAGTVASTPITVTYDGTSGASGYVMISGVDATDSVYVSGPASSGIKEQSADADSYSVYMNNGKINVNFDLSQSAKVNFAVYNIQGMLITSKTATYSAGEQHEVIDSELLTGVYLVKITKNGSTATYKVVK